MHFYLEKQNDTSTTSVCLALSALSVARLAKDPGTGFPETGCIPDLLKEKAPHIPVPVSLFYSFPCFCIYLAHIFWMATETRYYMDPIPWGLLKSDDK